MRATVLDPPGIRRGKPGDRGDPGTPNRARGALDPTGAICGPCGEGVGTGVCVGPWLLQPGEKKKLRTGCATEANPYCAKSGWGAAGFSYGAPRGPALE